MRRINDAFDKKVAAKSCYVESFEGHEFLCLPDQSSPAMDVAALEKRICNRIISTHCHFVSSLDAFAGVGISAYYWARCSRSLCLVENRREAVKLLRKNLPTISCNGCDLEIVPNGIDEFLDGIDMTFDFIDCDPFGSAHEIYPKLAERIDRGVVCITTGEIYQVYRGLNRKPGRNSAANYRGRRVRDWVVEEAIPEALSAFKDARLVHFYAYPTSLRMIIDVNDHRLDGGMFAGRPNFLDWLA